MKEREETEGRQRLALVPLCPQFRQCPRTVDKDRSPGLRRGPRWVSK